MARTVKTREQLLAEITLAEKKLAEKKAKLLSKLADLTKDSPGMSVLLDAVQTVADNNNATVVEVIKAVAKLKRTGLSIEKAIRKPKDQNAPKGKRGRKPKVAPL